MKDFSKIKTRHVNNKLTLVLYPFKHETSVYIYENGAPLESRSLRINIRDSGKILINIED